MNPIKIRLLGIGGADIKFGNFNIFIDAFNDYVEPFALNNNNIIFFSHDDGDHFNVTKVLEAIKNTNIQIIGPPSIAYPLLANTNLNPQQLKIVYPPHLKQPCEIVVNDLTVKVYQAKHFIDWEPIHISYLFKYNNKKIYFTGDSYCFNYEDPDIYDLDACIYSLIDKDLIEKRISSQVSAKKHVKELLNIKKVLNPRSIICNHLINCDWTVSPKNLQEELHSKKITSIFVPESSGEEILV